MALFMLCWISLAGPANGICTPAISLEAVSVLISHLHVSETFWVTKISERDEGRQMR